MLTQNGCRNRQERFVTGLEEAGLAAALISDPRDIYYLTGLLPEAAVTRYPSLLCLGPGLQSWMITGAADGEALVDERIVYRISEMATLNPNNHRRAAERAGELARDPRRLPSGAAARLSAGGPSLLAPARGGERDGWRGVVRGRRAFARPPAP